MKYGKDEFNLHLYGEFSTYLVIITNHTIIRLILQENMVPAECWCLNFLDHCKNI